MNDHLESDRGLVATGAPSTNEEPKPKRYQPPPGAAPKGFARPAAAPSAYKRFASSAARTPGEQGQPQLTGLLISACLETETAAAGTSRTHRLSAFTYALLEALRSGHARPAREVFEATTQRLQSLSFRQTPMCLEVVPGNLTNRTFITMEEGTMTATATSSSAPDTNGVEIPEQEVQKAIFNAFVTALPAIVSAIAVRRKELELEQVESDDDGADEGRDESRDKILGALATAVLPQVIEFAASQIAGHGNHERRPRIVQARQRTARKALDLGATGSGDQDIEKKLLPDLWRMAVAAAPDVVNVLRQHASRAISH